MTRSNLDELEESLENPEDLIRRARRVKRRIELQEMAALNSPA